MVEIPHWLLVRIKSRGHTRVDWMQGSRSGDSSSPSGNLKLHSAQRRLVEIRADSSPRAIHELRRFYDVANFVKHTLTLGERVCKEQVICCFPFGWWQSDFTQSYSHVDGKIIDRGRTSACR